MKIKNITIENFRSAKELSIDLDENLNVFVGINGSGKTTILDAIALSLSWLIARIRRQNGSGQAIEDRDIHYDAPFSAVRITCEQNKNTYSWKISKNAQGSINAEKSELIELSSLALHFQEFLAKAEKLPVMIYYPVGRAVDKINPTIKGSKSLSIWDVYDNALGVKQNFHSFFEWFRIQDDIRNEKSNSPNRWLQENSNWAKKKVKVFIKLLSESISNEIASNAEFEIRSQRLNKNIFFEDTNLLLNEISRLLFFVSNKQSDDSKRLFYALESIFYYTDIQEEIYTVENTKNYIKKISIILNEFSHLLNHDKLNDSYKKLFIEAFIFISILNFWWINQTAKKNLEKKLRELFAKLSTNSESSFELIGQLTNYLKQTIEIEQKGNNFINEDFELENVRRAIEAFIPEYSNLSVKRLPRPHMLVNKGNEQFNLDQLSQGEKSLITLIGDIARRLAIANSHSEDPLKESGIILIDEIDLHLHPSWQRLMIPQLTNIFPNCQFIVSTHSPQVVSHTRPESLFLLKNDKAKLTYNKATESYGKNTDRILEDLLGVDARPTKEKRAINKLYRLIEENKLDEAKKEIENLNKIIIGGDPELVKAEVLIKRKEIIGK